MFTKISKALLWLFIIGGIIASIAAGSSGKNMGWIIPVGIVGSFIAASGLGMMVEISENISRIAESSNRNCSNANIPRSDNGGAYNPTATAARLSAIASGAVSPDFKVCENCGEHNDKLASVCKSCGNYL